MRAQLPLLAASIAGIAGVIETAGFLMAKTSTYIFMARMWKSVLYEMGVLDLPTYREKLSVWDLCLGRLDNGAYSN